MLASPFACGDRVVVVVRCSGYGVVCGHAVDGAYDGVVYGDVDAARNVVVVAGGGVRARFRVLIPVNALTLPTAPPPPTLTPAPTPALPSFELAIEVP